MKFDLFLRYPVKNKFDIDIILILCGNLYSYWLYVIVKSICNQVKHAIEKGKGMLIINDRMVWIEVLEPN